MKYAWIVLILISGCGKASRTEKQKAFEDGCMRGSQHSLERVRHPFTAELPWAEMDANCVSMADTYE